MKKGFKLSIVAIAAMSTMVFGGGDIEPVAEVPMAVDNSAVSDNQFYVGLGYTFLTFKDGPDGVEGDGVLLNAGYQVNPYLAVEVRYATTVGDMDTTGGAVPSSNYELNNIGAYLKPMLQMEQLSLYALLGYGKTTFTSLGGNDSSESAFQWGIGAGYELNNNLSLQVDYVLLYDGNTFDTFTGDYKVDAVSVSVNYKF